MRKKEYQCGLSANKYQPREVIQCFMPLAASFLCSAPVFHPGSPSKVVSTPYICRDELPISLTYFWLSTFDSSSFIVVSSLSSP